MVAQRFSDVFWNTDFNSTQGFDILCKHLKDGGSASKGLEMFVKERAKVEDDYSKALAKLGKTSFGLLEAGNVGKYFSAVRAQLERVSSLHSDLSTELKEQAGRIREIRQNQADFSKQKEDLVKKLQAAKKDLYGKTLQAKSAYQKKYAACEVAKNAVDVGSGSKDYDKLQQKHEKSVEERNKVDDSYRSLVKQLESTRIQWESEMEQACDGFQQVEVERLKLFRNELWIHVNLDSMTLLKQDEGNEAARQVMETTDITLDVQDFITSNKTGDARPAPVVYEPMGAVSSSPQHMRIPPPLPQSTGTSTFFNSPSNHSSTPSDGVYSTVA